MKATTPIPYSMMMLERANRSTLIAAYIDLTGQKGKKEPSHPKTKVELLAALRPLVERRKEEHFAQRAAPRRQRSFGGITAEECNEFLRSLPPVPFYGEENEPS